MLKKIFLSFSIGIMILNSQDIKPITTIEVSGLVSDFVEDAGYLYVATDAGLVDIIDLSSQKIVRQIKLPTLQTIMGDTIEARVHSVDRYDGKTLLVSSGMSAYRNIWIDDGYKLKKIIDQKKEMMPKRAYFLNSGKIIFGSFDSSVSLYDKEEKSKIYDVQVSTSTMGGMILSKDKQKIITSDESGMVTIVDVDSSKILKQYSSEHVDNIYSVAYANKIIVTAGQDRRVGVYNEDTNRSYHIKSDFLVYTVGLSPSGKIGVYSSGTENYLQLFNTKSAKKGNRLIGHYATPNKIFFINENSIVSSGDENRVFFWNISKK